MAFAIQIQIHCLHHINIFHPLMTYCISFVLVKLAFVYLLSGTLFAFWDRFSWHAKMKRKNPLKKSCQSPVEHARRMMQCNFRARLEPNLFSSHFDRAGTVLATRYAHSSCARMTRAATTGYTTSVTSVTNPNSWTTYRACSTGF